MSERRTDEILGPVRWCNRCEEWLPEDDEFWYIEPRPMRPSAIYRCRCCMAEKNSRNHLRRSADRVRSKAPCNADMPFAGQRCARLAGHRDFHRTREALDRDAARRRPAA